MGASLLWRDLFQLLQRGLSKRTTRCGQQNPAHADVAQATLEVTGHALENRIVLAVDRQHDSATVAYGLHEQGA